jgi:hypothetical protein
MISSLVALSVAAQRMESGGLDAMIGRIRYADNRLSPHVMQTLEASGYNDVTAHTRDAGPFCRLWRR